RRAEAHERRVFFFQAEDGIRDKLVTGVQTCALPIYNLLLKWGSDGLQRRYLPRLAGDVVGAYALSEPESGSDAFGLQTRATRRDDRWVLEGRKLWITNGAEAGLFVVFANADFTRGYK